VDDERQRGVALDRRRHERSRRGPGSRARGRQHRGGVTSRHADGGGCEGDDRAGRNRFARTAAARPDASSRGATADAVTNTDADADADADAYTYTYTYTNANANTDADPDPGSDAHS